MFIRECKTPVTQIRGIGPKAALRLQEVGVFTVGDLLTYYPRTYEDRSTIEPLTAAFKKQEFSCLAEVVSHEYFSFGKNRTLKVWVRDESTGASLLCFGRNFLAEKFLPGKKFLIHGNFQVRRGEIQSSSFDAEEYSEHPQRFGRVLPVYPLTEGLTQGLLRGSIAQAVKEYGRYPEEEVPEPLRKKHGLLPKGEALLNIHFPRSLAEAGRARNSLVYEELFYLELIVAGRAFRRNAHPRKGKLLSRELAGKLLERLPFSLTEDQKRAVDEICSDLEGTKPMGRLLQGDVGCGKTLVAFLAGLCVIGSGRQVAFMAPTELLARQHADSAASLLSPLGVRLAFLSGNVKDEERRLLLANLAKGEIDLLIGTHALFTRDIEFKDLGLVIVDEQHKFGVLQRLSLLEKGESPDLLLMTATPIPRTLALTAFGDLEISTIKTMPEGRKQVLTHLAVEGNEGKVYDWVRREVKKGRQAYFVYPLIQASEKLAVKDAESAYERLAKEVFPGFSVALIHSRVPEEEKERTMDGFVKGKVQILVSTSVVEVGVNVPNATCMVVEHAERFGLSSLHQLRGRVGRGEEQSYAFLVYGRDVSEDGKKRLMVMKENSDGFLIAEEDLAIRGPGELTGARQSGFLRLSIADIVADLEVLKAAREDAFALREADPGFLSAENCVVREVFNRCPPFAEEFLAGG
jgi:ATP-dependent DNA helicase RecG